ncbi:MAG TPA: N-acetylglucosamine-6-phosphate deacetylase [Terriglobales bacterium]|nr:N-acetylglucosamine-6-phosphate deacetylase [Terriglobales bacterium]
MTDVFYADRLLTPLAAIPDAALAVEDGRILAAAPRADFSAPAHARLHHLGDVVLAPGLVELHVHGGAGFDFMSADAAGLAAIRRHLARHGVTSFLATTVSAPWGTTLAAVERLAAAGCDLHLEGPFLSPQRRGVHPLDDLLLPTLDRLEQLAQRADGRLRLLTLAPELDGALACIAAAQQRGIVVSLGHSDATLDQARAAVLAGARHVTHAFNAMRPLHHRDPGLLGEALANPTLSAEIIADGIHVDPLLVALFLRLKGAAQAVLVSDGISAAGCGDGRFSLGGIRVEVAHGRCLADGRLAGSVLTPDQAVRNVMSFAGWELAPALRLASLNPATLLGWTHKGRLAPGADADFLVLSPGGAVLETYIAGQKVD